jgi:aurora kinase
VAREISIHARLDHPHIVALFAAFEDAERVYLLQEYAEGGDLFDEMKRALGRMPEPLLARRVLGPVMSALAAVHAAGFIHRDVKPENTLFAAGHQLKLAGVFGRLCL